jgi:secondary thiamine-phosphate synthase enzyme
MAFYTLNVKTDKRAQFVNITHSVLKHVKDANVREGLCTVYVPHTTAGVTINEAADPDVVRDMLAKLARLVPEHEGYAHAEGNSDAHIKASLIGSSVLIPVQNGTLALGTWQGIFFCEFDGPRSRSVHVSVTGQAQ